MSMFMEWLPGLRQARRNLWRSPLFAATALLTLGLGLVRMLACFIPAWRAAQTDPARILKAE